MAKKTGAWLAWLQDQVIHVTRIHFFLAAVYMAYTIASDAWQLITPTVVLERWVVGVGLLSFNTIFWFLAHNKTTSTLYYRLILYGVILVDIGFAAFAIYNQRGMASRGIVLFALPLLVSAVLLSRRALLATAALSVAAYSMAAILYFVVHPNEGYHAELYIEVGFYCALFFVFVALLWTVIHPKRA